jgi:hypothetical protein
MTKYIVLFIALVVAGGAFMYSTQTADAPVVEAPTTENPFGDGSEVVGEVENRDTDKDGRDTVMDEKTAPTTVPTADTGTAGAASATQPGVISRAELAKHGTQSDCWIGYKGTVYDITNWLPRHPGSAGAIAPFCGTADEFAAAFNRQHGTSREGKLQKEGVNEGALGN